MGETSSHNRSVSTGNIIGSAVLTGDSNTVSVEYRQTELPPQETVDIRAEIAAIKEILAALQTPDSRKIERAMEDVADELEKDDPDKNEVGSALERALKYATTSEELASVTEKLAGHLKGAAAWLGQNWHKLLGIVGMVV
ncbi:MAG: hypothetical protein AB4040_01290 [Synechococcus sp.]